MRFFTSKKEKLPRGAQKGLLPRKEFITQGKERFLAAFDASALARNAQPARTSSMALLFKFGIGAMAVVCVAVGVSVYADTTNVPATSALYPLKRISENVQLALTPSSGKAQLQATLAVRRANEIDALRLSNPTSTLIPRLTSDLDREISGSLKVAARGGVGTDRRHYDNGGNGTDGVHEGSSTVFQEPTSTPSETTTTGAMNATVSAAAGPINVYCNAFDMSTSGVLFGYLEGSLTQHPDALAQFNEQCGSGSYTPADHAGHTQQRSGDEGGHTVNIGL